MKTLHSTPKPLLHERDAADILGLSIAWMQKARYLGNEPKYIKVAGQGGRAVRYRYSDLISYIDNNIIETADTRVSQICRGNPDD